jgi:hypothetical protein
MLEVQENIIKGGQALMPLSFSYCIVFVNPSILSQFVIKGDVKIFRHLKVVDVL